MQIQQHNVNCSCKDNHKSQMNDINLDINCRSPRVWTCKYLYKQIKKYSESNSSNKCKSINKYLYT